MVADRPTDRPTDPPSYRDEWTHLITTLTHNCTLNPRLTLSQVIAEAEDGGVIIYSITSDKPRRDGLQQFMIKQDGQVSLLKSLDYETMDTYLLTIEAKVRNRKAHKLFFF